MSRYVVAFFVFFTCYASVQAAETVCYEYRISKAWAAPEYAAGISASFACSAFASSYATAGTASGFSTRTGSGTATSETSCTVTGDYTITCASGSTDYPLGCGIADPYEITVLITKVTLETCPSNPCDGLSGLPGIVGYSGTPPGQLCRSDDGDGGSGGVACEVKKKGAGISTGTGFFGQVEFTGQVCQDEEPPPTPPNCKSGPAGQICIDKKKQYCGSVNGEAVCMSDVPTGQCMLMAKGGAICDSDSPDVPKDDMDNPIDPDEVIEGHDGEGNTTEYNVYSPTTIEGSTTVTGSGNPKGGETTGNSEEDDAEEEPPCVGVEECAGGLGDLDGIQGSTAAFMARVKGSPLVSAVAAIGTSIPDGECPTPTFEIFGEEMSFESMCEVFDPLAAVIAAVMLFVWGIYAVRIVMSA